jgi:hypothetical protein
MSIEFTGIEMGSDDEAIQYADAGGGVAISVAGGSFVVTRAEAERLAEAGVEFAYLCDHEMPDGSHRIVTVPVNDE